MVSPKDVCAQEITRYVRAMQSTDAESVLSMYNLMDGSVEALEFEVTGDVPHLGERLADVKLKPNILISAVIRGNRSIIPDGGTVIQPGDHAVIVAKAGRILDVDAILEGSV
jgi:trk system potassium uptake protein TrkA